MAHAIDTEDVDLAMGLLTALVAVVPGNQASVELSSMGADSVLAMPRAREHAGYPYALGLAALTAGTRGEFSLAEELADAATAAAQASSDPGLSVVPLDLVVATVRINGLIMRGAWSEAAQVQVRAAELGRTYGQVGFAAN